MAKKKDESKAEQSPDGAHLLPVQIHRQYLRDLSFENPNAPTSLNLTEAPEMSIDIDINVNGVEDENIQNFYEVVLSLRVTTLSTDAPVFLVEVDHATLIEISPDVPEDKHHPILFIEVPRFSFPYVTQIITNICLQAGFPPLFLRPIDFHSLYLERFGENIEDIIDKAVDAVDS